MAKEQQSLNVGCYKSDADLRGASDGILPYHHHSISNKDFKNERELQEYIMLNAAVFVEQYLDDILVKAIKGMNLDVSQPGHVNKTKRRGTRVADIVFVCRDNVYNKELKNPKVPAEKRGGIGKLLDYGRDFQYPKKEMLLITTVFDINTAHTIKHYGLPIRYFYINKDQILEYTGDA